MNYIRDFVRSGGSALTDAELQAIVCAGMLVVPRGQQRNWQDQVTLALDAYGTKPQLDAAARARAVLQQ